MAAKDPPRPAKVPASAKWFSDRWGSGVLRNAKREGRWRTWSRQGVLLSDATWTSGQADGTSRIWWDNGSPRSERIWKSGRPGDGVHIEYACAGSRKPWLAFGKKLLPVIRKVEADYSGTRLTALRYYDKDGNLRGRGGKALDPAVARAERKKKPSAQAKLAALLKGK